VISTFFRHCGKEERNELAGTSSSLRPTPNTDRTGSFTPPTMTDFRPHQFLRRAWDDTNSHWGKACVFLFYTYIWLQMIWAIECIITPRAGWECMYQGVTDYAAEMMSMFFRATNLMALAFLVYAHREGIQLWNVSLVFLFNAVLTWIVSSSNYMDLDGMPDCVDVTQKAFSSITWITFWWTVLNVLCSALEEGSKPRGTTAETTPLSSREVSA
jgi:hypothetical protein